MKKSLAWVLFLWGCGSWPPGEITSIQPGQMVDSEATWVEVHTELTPILIVDYRTRTVVADVSAELTLGQRPLGDGRFPPGGVFRVLVPTVFAPGTYDVRIALADRRELTRAGALTVVGGTWPEGYTIDPIGPQVRFAPFDITVRAVGAAGTTFRGNVSLRASPRASLGPSLSDAFVDGVLTQTVVLDSSQPTEAITVTDLHGRTATSDPFTLN